MYPQCISFPHRIRFICSHSWTWTWQLTHYCLCEFDSGRIYFWKNVRADVTLPVCLPIFLLHFPLPFWGILLLLGKFVEKSTFWASGRKYLNDWSLSPLQIWLRKVKRTCPPEGTSPSHGDSPAEMICQEHWYSCMLINNPHSLPQPGFRQRIIEHFSINSIQPQHFWVRWAIFCRFWGCLLKHRPYIDLFRDYSSRHNLLRHQAFNEILF